MGMYGNARIPGSRPEALMLPASAVFLQDDQAWVVRLVDSKAVRTPVRLGRRDRQQVEGLRKQTLSSGPGGRAEWEDFTDADLVVGDNPSTLFDGHEVAIRAERPSLASLESPWRAAGHGVRKIRKECHEIDFRMTFAPITVHASPSRRDRSHSSELNPNADARRCGRDD
jgi:hypothetical protein